MSWGEYLTRMKKDGLKHAAICGSDNASWIQVSEGSNITQDELKTFLQNIGKEELLACNGIRLGNMKYMYEKVQGAVKKLKKTLRRSLRILVESNLYISGTESICRGKWKTGGVHAAKSKQTLVLGIYDETMQPGQAASIVEKMADYLTTQNY